MAVAFSGGVDSSVIVACASRVTEVVACSAFAEGSLDRSVAGIAAEALGVELISETLTKDVVIGSLKTMRLPFEPSVMDKGLWSLFSAVARIAAEVGAETLLLGQLADELFGGYAKYQKALVEKGEDAAEQMMASDVAEYQRRGKVRDLAACSAWLKPEFPYEVEEIKALAESFPLSYKIKGGERKAVLRRAAVILGVPQALSEAPKKAAQYSSGVQKVILGSRF